MKAKEFSDRYYLHDSLMDQVSFAKEEAVVSMTIDLAFWMQSWYEEGMAETGLISVTFRSVEEYSCPENVDWKQISILQAEASDGAISFSLLNDAEDSCFEMRIKSDDIEVKILDRCER